MTMQNIDIPEGWREATLGEVCEKIYSGGTPSTQREDFYGGKIPWIRTQEVNFNYLNNTEIKITESGLKNSSAKWIPKNTVIIAMYGNSAGRVAFSNIEATTNQACCNCIASKSISDSKFIFFNLLGRYSEIAGMANGAAQQNLSVGVLKELKILLPPLSEQKEISAILSSFDNKIELLRRQNETLEKTAQTIFQEWFGKYSIDDELPEGWVFDKMETLIGELEAGRRPKGGVGEIKSGIPSIGAENVKGLLTSNFSNVKFIPESFYASMNVGKIKDNDILIYKDGGAPGEFRPNFTIIGGGYPFNEGAINEHVFRLQAKKDFQQYYLFFWLTGRISIGELKSIGGKAAIPGINGTDFKNLTLLIPEEVILKKFHDCIKPLIKKVLGNNLQIQNLSWSRDTLLPKLMSGEIRV